MKASTQPLRRKERIDAFLADGIIEGVSGRGTQTTRAIIHASPRQTDLAYNANLAFPLFHLDGIGKSMAAAFRRLSPFGLKPSDIKLDPPWAPPTDAVLACPLFDVGVQVRYKLSEIEIWTRSVEFARGPQAVPLIEAACGVVEDITGTAPQMVVHGINLAAHITLDDTNVPTLLRRHVTPDVGLLRESMELEPFGIILQGKTLDPAGKVTVDVQQSLLFPGENSAFLRVLVAFYGDTPVAVVVARFSDLLESVLTRLGIEIGF